MILPATAHDLTWYVCAGRADAQLRDLHCGAIEGEGAAGQRV
jgi:hypothetical protein